MHRVDDWTVPHGNSRGADWDLGKAWNINPSSLVALSWISATGAASSYRGGRLCAV